jgi:organic radical activating enzyme
MHTQDGMCHIENPPGSQNITLLPNPVDVETLIEVIEPFLQTTPHHSISLTGGEPLLYHRYLAELLPKIQPKVKFYLETSGTQPEFLKGLLEYIDITAMDIKLPSATMEPPQYEANKEFYQLAEQHTECFVKLIFGNATPEDELIHVREIVTNKATPIILQPISSLVDRSITVTAREILKVESLLSQWFQDVRVIPQTHKMIQVL